MPSASKDSRRLCQKRTSTSACLDDRLLVDSPLNRTFRTPDLGTGNLRLNVGSGSKSRMPVNHLQSSEARRTWRRALFVHALPATACFNSPSSVTGAVPAFTVDADDFGFAAGLAAFGEL